jgi:hypothetical protein
MNTNIIDKIAVRPVTASTTRRGRQHSQLLPATIRQPFLGFQFYLGLHPFHTVLECTSIHYARLVQMLPQRRLLGPHCLRSVPGHLETFFNQSREQRQAPQQPPIAHSILAGVNRVRPGFLMGYARARLTHTPHVINIFRLASLTASAGNRNNIFPKTTIIPAPTFHLSLTGLAFPLHATAQNHIWAPQPTVHKSHRPVKKYGILIRKQDLIRFGKRTVVSMTPFLVPTICYHLHPSYLLLWMGRLLLVDLISKVFGR